MATYLPEEYASRIREGSVSPIVLFSGEEQLLADEGIALLLGTLVPEGVGDFNVDVLDGTRVTIQDVLARAAAFPMMSDRRVVVVRRFERLVSNEQGRTLFQTYLDNPSPSTCLALSIEKGDLRRHPYRDIQKNHDLVDCKPLRERDIPGWVQARARRMGKSMDGEASFMLQSYVGTSLHGLLRELEKLTTYIGDRTDITTEDVAAAVGASRGFTVFDLQDAVGHRNFQQAVSVVRRMMLYGEQAPLIVATLTRYFMQLMAVQESARRRMPQKEMASTLGIHPYRVKLLTEVARSYTAEEIAAAFHALRASDRAVKTSDVNPVGEMELMLHSIVRGGAA